MRELAFYAGIKPHPTNAASLTDWT